jgi:paraquat-inducible protein A
MTEQNRIDTADQPAGTDQSAAEHDMMSCGVCGLLCRAPSAATPEKSHCPRCHAKLSKRKPHSIGRTWAYLVASYALYIPANILPIMEAHSMREIQIDTIMSGVIYLWEAGTWHLAIIVFTASIVVPTFKLLGLSWLAWTVQRGETRWRAQRLRLYRFIDMIGRWSMLDIYVVALLVALVQLKLFASVHAGPAIIAFGAVVILTLLAASSFDPRLIWDERKHD